MTDYQAGRTAAVFLAGTKVENLSTTYEQEAQGLESMKAAFGMATRCLTDFQQALQQDLTDARVTIKEAEIGKLYIGRCAELVHKLYFDAEAKRLQALGAAAAMKQAVNSLKRLYDEESDKLQVQRSYDQEDPKDPKDRPVGYAPPIQKLTAPAKRRSKKVEATDK